MIKFKQADNQDFMYLRPDAILGVHSERANHSTLLVKDCGLVEVWGDLEKIVELINYGPFPGDATL